MSTKGWVYPALIYMVNLLCAILQTRQRATTFPTLLNVSVKGSSDRFRSGAMATAMGTGTRPPDLGRLPSSSTTAPPLPPRSSGTPALAGARSAGATSTSPPSSSTGTSAWTGARTQAGTPHIDRPYSQIISDSSSSTSPIILQIRLFKLPIPDRKPLNLSDTQLGEFLFEILEIPIAQVLALDFQTGRYDLREMLVKHDTDLNKVLTYDSPISFKEHEISVSIVSNQSTRVTFKGVPLSVPNEELLYLCSLHGVIKDGVVHQTTIRLGGKTRISMPSSTRWIEVQLTPGNPLRNYYWLTGPGQGESGRRVTVLHSNQGPRQCSWCLKHAPPTASSPLLPSHCQSGGNGKMCEEKKTNRCKMSDYINELKNDGYVPLRTQYYTNLQRSFPALDRNQPSSLTDPKQVDMLDQQTDQEEHPEKQVEEETPQVSPPAQDVSVPKDTSIDHTPASESANEVSDTPLVLTQLPVSETANDVTDAEAVKDTTDAPPTTVDDLTLSKSPPKITLTKVSVSVLKDNPNDDEMEVETEHSDIPKDDLPIETGISLSSLGIKLVRKPVENTDSLSEAPAKETSEEDTSVLKETLSEPPLTSEPEVVIKASSEDAPAEAAGETTGELSEIAEASGENTDVPTEASEPEIVIKASSEDAPAEAARENTRELSEIAGASGENTGIPTEASEAAEGITGALAEPKKKSLPKPKPVHILKGSKSITSLKVTQTPSDNVPITTKASKVPALSFPKDMKNCSVSLHRGPNVNQKRTLSQPTPNQTLAPPSPLFTPNKRNIKPSAGQGLYHWEIPLMRFVTEAKPYDEEEARQYVERAIRLKEITFKSVEDEIISSKSDQVLKGCKENYVTNSAKKRYQKLEKKIDSLIDDPDLRREAERKGRTVSETDMADEETKSAKSSRRTPPSSP